MGHDENEECLTDFKLLNMVLRERRMHDGIHVRNVADVMVVGHDDVEAEFLRPGRGFECRDAVVDRDNEADSVSRRLLDDVGVQSIAVREAGGDVPVHVAPELVERADHDGGTRDSIHIVVPDDADALSRFDGLPDAVDSPPHVVHEKRVQQGRSARMEEGLGRLDSGAAARSQDSGHQRMQVELLRQLLNGVNVRFFADPLAVSCGDHWVATSFRGCPMP